MRRKCYKVESNCVWGPVSSLCNPHGLKYSISEYGGRVSWRFSSVIGLGRRVVDVKCLKRMAVAVQATPYTGVDLRCEAIRLADNDEGWCHQVLHACSCVSRKTRTIFLHGSLSLFIFQWREKCAFFVFASHRQQKLIYIIVLKGAYSDWPS